MEVSFTCQGCGKKIYGATVADATAGRCGDCRPGKGNDKRKMRT